MTATEQALPPNDLEVLSVSECERLLGAATVGRIAFIIDDLPMMVPVNYRSCRDRSGLRILLRTRPGHVIDRAPRNVAFEIDGIDHSHRQGWSVLIRGVLEHLTQDEVDEVKTDFDPDPWARHERTSWLAITSHLVTGRRLPTPSTDWTLPSEAYL
ncbi:MAG: hypothetical protein JWM05_1441 [Acidimicrobiales bacterium]|nr:hypothetical protein [Acidimicrobiales bacterium]